MMRGLLIAGFLFALAVTAAAQTPRVIDAPGDYALTAADCGKVVLVDAEGAVNIAVAAAASLGQGCAIDVKKRATGAGVVTLTPVTGEALDGAPEILLPYTKDVVRLYSDGATIEALTAWRRVSVESHRTVTCDKGDHTLRSSYNWMPKDVGALIRVDTSAIAQWNLPSCDLGIYLNPVSQFVGPPYRGATLELIRVDATTRSVRIFAYANETINGHAYIDVVGQWTRLLFYGDGQQWFANKASAP